MKQYPFRPSGLAVLYFILLLCSVKLDRCESSDGKLEQELDIPLSKTKESPSETSGDSREDGSYSGSGSEDEETDPPKAEDLYFYRFDKGSTVTEFAAPASKEEKEEPDFLYKPQQGHVRIVEFYAHWCPHCQALRPHYNIFAEKMKSLAEQSNIQLDVYAVSCVPHRSLCMDLDVKGYPTIKLFVGNDGIEEEGTEISHGDLHPFFVLQAIAEKTGNDLSLSIATLRQDGEIYGNKVSENNGGELEDDSPFWLPRTKRDVYNDIYLSFHFAMEHGIFVGRDPPNEEARNAFENWIILLNQVLPPTWRLKTLISEIGKNLETVLDSEDNLMQILDRHPPPVNTWSRSCSRDDPAMGYTCGLWQLFHTTTLGVVEWNLAGTEDFSYSPMEVGNIFRSYIEHFFGCQVCRVNFLQEYDSCGFSRCDRLNEELGGLDDWKELSLWLFELHNGVNSRLMNERAERDHRTPTQQELNAVQWPARKDCPLCWHSNGHFDLDALYSFLQLTYWPSELIPEVRMREILLSTGRIVSTSEEEEEAIESWVYSLIGFLFASFVLSGIHKQREIQRTGKHKKADDDYI